MAGAHCATISSLYRLTIEAHTPSRRIALLSSLSSPRFSKRKNHLRQKILRIIPKPYPDTFLPQSTPPISIDSSPEQQQQENYSSFQFSVEEMKETEALDAAPLAEASEVTQVFDNDFGKFSKNSLFKFGLWAVGAFFFQTILAVWVLGSIDFDEKIKNSDSEDKITVPEMGFNGHYGQTNSKFLLKEGGNALCGNLENGNGGVLYGDESELGRKIDEIRIMAREARKREKLELKRNDFVRNSDQGDDGEDFTRSSIGKEVSGRLIRLKKILENSSENSPLSLANYLKKDDEDDKVGLDAKKANAALMFKKKYKFRTPSVEGSFKPKGFMGLDDLDVKNTTSNNKRHANHPGIDRKENYYVPVEKDISSKLPKEPKSMGKSRNKLGRKRRANAPNEVRAVENDVGTGVLPDNTETSTHKAEESRQLNMQNSRSIAKGSLTSKIGNQKSDSQPHLWWFSLPYVLTILMRRGGDGEGPNGLYSLKSISEETGHASHTLAFEDRNDATNFCYLLQSFFDELGDFSAEIIPVPIKEFGESVKFHGVKVLVVKKGQLQLYAGQPLADVEMVLHSLLPQS